MLGNTRFLTISDVLTHHGTANTNLITQYRKTTGP